MRGFSLLGLEEMDRCRVEEARFNTKIKVKIKYFMSRL
jgi:hypothetical protein